MGAATVDATAGHPGRDPAQSGAEPGPPASHLMTKARASRGTSRFRKNFRPSKSFLCFSCASSSFLRSSSCAVVSCHERGYGTIGPAHTRTRGQRVEMVPSCHPDPSVPTRPHHPGTRSSPHQQETHPPQPPPPKAPPCGPDWPPGPPVSTGKKQGCCLRWEVLSGGMVRVGKGEQ